MQKIVNLTGKKIAAIALSAVLLVGGSVAGTMAYLQSQTETVTNTFTVGQVHITLDEASVTKYGEKVPVDSDGKEVRTTQGNSYTLVPGQKYVKDPTVYVKGGSADCYLYVRIQSMTDFEKMVGSDGDSIFETSHYGLLSSQVAQNGWTKLDGVPDVYYRAVSTASEQQEFKVFAGFELRSNLTNDNVMNLGVNPINVTAYAIQSQGFTDAKAAWNAVNFALTN